MRSRTENEVQEVSSDGTENSHSPEGTLQADTPEGAGQADISDMNENRDQTQED